MADRLTFYGDGNFTLATIKTNRGGAGAPPAPCDEPAKRGDAPAAPGRSPAGAVGEAEAPATSWLEGEVERLKTDRNNLRTACAQLLVDKANLQSALSTAQAAQAEAVELLKPFATEAQFWDQKRHSRSDELLFADDKKLHAGEVTLGDIRRARAYLARLSSQEPPRSLPSQQGGGER